jgi:hypothetical protein
LANVDSICSFTPVLASADAAWSKPSNRDPIQPSAPECRSRAC